MLFEVRAEDRVVFEDNVRLDLRVIAVFQNLQMAAVATPRTAARGPPVRMQNGVAVYGRPNDDRLETFWC